MNPINLAGLELEHPVMIGAGTCKTVEDVVQALRTPAAGIVIGSILHEARTGNEGDVYFTDALNSLNSLGMPEPGIAYWEQQLPAVADEAHRHGKIIVMNVAAFKPADYVELAVRALRAKADAVELNFGCPNLWDGGKQKEIVSFDAAFIHEVLGLLEQEVPGDAVVGIKFSPFSNPAELQRTAVLLLDRFGREPSTIKFVTTTNTFPNGYRLHPDGRPWISFKGSDGLAGVGGPGLKPIGQGQVRQWRKLLPDRIAVIGVGGISLGQDVLGYLHAGATAVQVVTDYLNRGKAAIDSILTELVDLSEQPAPQTPN